MSAPCGGCGERDPAKRCLGCLHDFTGGQQAAIITDTQPGTDGPQSGPVVNQKGQDQ